MTLARTVLLTGIVLTLTACFRGSVPPPAGEQSSSSVVAEAGEDDEQTGVLRKMGASIYMQGTHILTLDDSSILILESSSLDLDQYDGVRVTVEGKARPTVEEAGRIMNVTWVTRRETEQLSSAAVSVEASSAEAEAESSAAVALSSSSSRRSLAAPPTPVSSLAASAFASSMGSATASASNPAVQAMAQTKLDASLWTQRYCSTHVGFCVPVHKNWWYKSFGVTNSSLWHVEVSPEEIDNLGNGVLSIDLVSGSLPSGISDGTVNVQGESVIGYRSWTGNRHFEITAPVELRAAVEYMTRALTAEDVSAP